MTKDIVKPPARATRQQTPITQYKPQTPRTATPAVAPVVAAPPNKIGRPRKNLPVQAPPVQMKEVEVEVGQRIVIPPPPPPPAKDTTTRTLVITPPKFEEAILLIRGTTPLVQHKFSEKAQIQIRETQEAGSQAGSKRKREPKDFEAAYNGARHIAAKRYGGWDGIHAGSFRNAMISACRVCGFKMTLAKLSLFVRADGFSDDGIPLVKITGGTPTMMVAPARNDNGSIDLRSRPKWAEGWEAKVHLRWDADQFSANDVFNLMSRVGIQVGIGEGRPDSKMSAGCGWGQFEVVS